MQANEAGLDLCGLAAFVILVVIIAAACAQCKHHDESEDNCSKLFHLQFSSNKNSFILSNSLAGSVIQKNTGRKRYAAGEEIHK